MYSSNLNQRILQALLVAHGVRKFVVSPGGTNPAMVMSLQMDNRFELYSCVDERSAGYMACGLSEASDEPVGICCTGATASRNYMSALTEAFYKKIPIVVITCSRPNCNIGHLFPQVTNRSVYPKDILVDGEQLQIIKDEDDRRDVEFKVNKALLALTHHGGGPVHFNVETSTQFCNVETLPEVKVIRRLGYESEFPVINPGRIGVFIGSHKSMSSKMTSLIDEFCEKYNAVVLADYTSGYKGKYFHPFALLGTQNHKIDSVFDFDLLLHFGEISGDYLTWEFIRAKEVWRINDDGEIRIRFGSLQYVFEMSETYFFSHYNQLRREKSDMSLYKHHLQIYNDLFANIPELPLSHIYIAKILSDKLPCDSVVHFSILNALRSWNFFLIDKSIRTDCNVGGFGIDGCTSTLIGASLANPDKIHYLFSGDLAFFYDLNSIGNRHISNNIRIILVNDGKGAEFTHFRAMNYDGDRETFIAGDGHFGNKSKDLIKHFAVDLGFNYIQIQSCDEFEKHVDEICSPDFQQKPLFVEVILSDQGQSLSWEVLSNLNRIPDIEDSTIHKIYRKFKNLRR